MAEPGRKPDSAMENKAAVSLDGLRGGKQAGGIAGETPRMRHGVRRGGRPVVGAQIMTAGENRLHRAVIRRLMRQRSRAGRLQSGGA